MVNSNKLTTFNLAEKTAKVNILTGQTVQNIVEIGKTLLEVKENISYGDFQKWLETDINYSKRTAYNFMKVAQEFPDVQSVANLGIRKLLALTNIEKDDRKKIINDYALETMTVKEVEETVNDEKMVKEVNEFMERLSKRLPVNKNTFDYVSAGLENEDILKLKEIANHSNEIFENERIQQYETLLELKEVFRNEKKFAKFVIQTGLKDAIERLVFKREFPDTLLTIWDKIESSLKKEGFGKNV